MIFSDFSLFKDTHTRKIFFYYYVECFVSLSFSLLKKEKLRTVGLSRRLEGRARHERAQLMDARLSFTFSGDEKDSRCVMTRNSKSTPVHRCFTEKRKSRLEVIYSYFLLLNISKENDLEAGRIGGKIQF